MARANRKYQDAATRKAVISSMEAGGWHVLHDDYILGWQHGDPLTGTLSFTDEPGPSSPPRLPSLESRVVTIEAKLLAAGIR